MKPEKPSSELQRLARAFGYSFEGLKAAYSQPAFRFEVWVACVAIPAALFITSRDLPRIALIGSVVLVLIVELLNCGIEAAIDRISPETHELSKIAKDVGSAAVLLAIINACVVWFLIVV